MAPLAEETENPKRNLPIVIVLSTIGIAIFYAFVNWGVLVGHGTTSVVAGNFTQSDQIFDLARRLWSGAWILVLIATVNSALAVSIAIQNASTQGVLRDGQDRGTATLAGQSQPALEDALERDHRDDGPDGHAAMALGSTIGPVNQFGMMGIAQTLGLIVVYGMGNLGVVWWYYRKRQGAVQVVAARDHSDRDHGGADLGRLEERLRTAHLRPPDGARLRAVDRDRLVAPRDRDPDLREPHRQGGLAAQGG